MPKSKFAERVAATKKMLEAAAQLAKKQAELTKLESVVLPKIYFAIGQILSSREDLPEELGAIVARVKEVRAAMGSRSVDAGKPTPDGVWAHATRYAEKASQAASDASASVQLAAICTQLGKVACEKYGNRFVPAEQGAELQNAQSRRDELLSEIAVLESGKGLGFLSARQIALAGVLATCFLSACVALKLFGYPLIAIYALARLCVLIATIICLYLACVSVWHYVRTFLFGQAEGLRQRTPAGVRKAVVRAIVLVLLLYLMPIPRVAAVGQRGVQPVRRGNAAEETVSETANARQSASGNQDLAAGPSDSASDESARKMAARKMAADTFMGILMQAAAMDQMARRAMPQIPQQHSSGWSSGQSPSPNFAPPQPYIGGPTFGGGQMGTSSAVQARYEGLCSRCGKSYFPQQRPGNTKCDNWVYGGSRGPYGPCEGAVVWTPR
jgi:hypothetical protein